MKRYLLVFFTLVTTTALAEDKTLTFTTGVDYSSGKYGQAEDTRITYIPLTGKYEMDRLIFKVTVPWVRIDGSGGVSGDSRIVTDTGISSTRTAASGLGDVVAGVTYNALILNPEKFYLDLGAKVKIPTASSSRGLGTGETDYTVLADAYKTFGSITALATIGYKVLGDPDGVTLNNTWFGTLGGVYKFDKQNSAGITVDLREATTQRTSELREYTLFYAHKFNDTYKMQSYLVHGDTRSSTDWGGGAMLSVSW